MTNVAINCLFTELRPVADLREHPKNPNRHPDSQIAALAKVLQQQGWRSPIVVSSRSGCVVKGHGRLFAARKIGLETCPIEIQDYASDAEEMADMVADNRIAGMSEVAQPELLDLLKQVKDAGGDIIGMGYTEADFQNLVDTVSLLDDTDDVPSVGGSVLQYNIVFSNDEQQQQWFALLKRLKLAYPDSESVGQRLSRFIADVIAKG